MENTDNATHINDPFVCYEYELGDTRRLIWEEVRMVADTRVTYRLYRSLVSEETGDRIAYSFAVKNDIGESDMLFDIAQTEVEARSLFDDFSRGTVPPCTFREVYCEYDADI